MYHVRTTLFWAALGLPDPKRPTTDDRNNRYEAASPKPMQPKDYLTCRHLIIDEICRKEHKNRRTWPCRDALVGMPSRDALCY